MIKRFNKKIPNIYKKYPGLQFNNKRYVLKNSQ